MKIRKPLVTKKNTATAYSSKKPFFSPKNKQINNSSYIIQKQSTSEQDNAQSKTPLSDAVNVVKAHSSSTGTTLLSEGLVMGIMQAENMFLENAPLNGLSEYFGFSGTIGPGQLGSPAIDDVDNLFGGARVAFSDIYGTVPNTWEDKATDPNWSYFYIAGYLARCINEGERIFKSSSSDMSNEDLGVIPLGIAIYHGAFTTIRDMRRRIAQKKGLSPADITWAMVLKELRSGNAKDNEMELEKYTQLVQGSWNFNFDITARLPKSRRFQVQDGKLRISILAKYQNANPSEDRGTSFKVKLRRYKSVGGFENHDSFDYGIGSQEVKTWTDLPKGEYYFLIEKNEKKYSPDHLIGQGTVKTIF